MKIVILDGKALNPGDLSYDCLRQFGELTIYNRTDSEAEAIKKIMESIAPDLIAALQTQANAQLMTDTIGNMAPYALAKGESAADFINTLLRGTTLENVVKNMTPSGK